MIIPNQSHVIYNAMIPDGNATRGELTSNTVNTEVLSYSITKTLSADKTTAREGDIVHNTITVTNNSTTKLTHTFICNPTPDGGSYVAGSVKLNGETQPNSNMTSGFFMPDLDPGETITIEYDMQIGKPTTGNVVADVSEFQYTVNDPVRGAVSYAENTAPVKIKVISEKLSVEKSVDKAFATKGETLTYTVTFTNNGNIDIDDIYFTDRIPQGTTFVENSVSINGVNILGNPEAGYNVSNLTPGQSCTTSFQVTID